MENKQSRIQMILCWDDMEYASLQFEMGNLYLEVYLGVEPAWKMNRERLYWSWWKVQWEIRNAIWLSLVDTSLSLKKLRKQYRDLHHPATLQVKPHRRMMQESYARMTSQLISEKKET